MKKEFLFCLILVCSSVAQASSYRLLGGNLNAPTINNKTNVYNPVVGEIIYDSSDSTFYGYNQASTWIALS